MIGIVLTPSPTLSYPSPNPPVQLDQIGSTLARARLTAKRPGRRDDAPLSWQIRPARHGRGRPHQVHASIGKALEGGVCLVGEIYNTRHDDRRSAVCQQIDFFRELWIVLQNLAEQIVDGPGHAVTLRLSSNDDRVEL